MSKMNGFENFIIICYYNLAIFPQSNKAQWFELTFEIISLQYLYQKAKDLSFTLARYVNFFKHRFGATLLICA